MINSKKTYYSIREVCEITDLEPHVLRYWESEFSSLRPKKNRAGNRAYREKDIELIQQIKHLLYDEQFTIPGARKKLAELKAGTIEEPESIEQPDIPEETPAPIISTPIIEADAFQQNLFEQQPSAEHPRIVKEAIGELKEVLGILTR